MPESHDLFTLAVGKRPGRFNKAVGQAGALHRQGVVAGGGKCLRQSAVQALAVVVNGRWAAVKNLPGRHDGGAAGAGNDLVPQPDARKREEAGDRTRVVKWRRVE